MIKIFLLFSLIIFSSGCKSSATAKSINWYVPKPDSLWHIQLSGKINTTYDVDIYDIDLFDVPIDTIDLLHQKQKKVICYFSAGSFESWREDAKLFLSKDIGKKMDGWDENWIDIRSQNVKNIMLKRLDLAKQKGCDGVDPDNVNAYTQKSGFDLSAEDQLEYNRFLANEAHKRGLGIGLKNDVDQIKELVDLFDFAVNEECLYYKECSLTKPFSDANKAIFHIEYDKKFLNDREKMCQQSKNFKLNTLLLPLELDDSFRISCQ